jgi:hypothetical protein
MDLGWEFTAILIVVLSVPLMGFVIGIVIGGRRFLRRELWLVVAAYAWFGLWMLIAYLRPSETVYSVAEHMNCASLVAYPALGIWFIVNGIRLQQAKWLHANKVCLHCGYDLRGQTIARCPECGQPMMRRPS